MTQRGEAPEPAALDLGSPRSPPSFLFLLDDDLLNHSNDHSVFLTLQSVSQTSFTGPFFLVSALMINVLKERPFNNGHLIMGTFVKDDFSLPTFYINYNGSLSVVASTTFLTGIIQVGAESPNS